VPNIELVAPTARDTKAVAAAVASLLRPRDVVTLTGDLGAGKTTFVQGAAAALEVTQPVSSPTFVLVKEYAGRLRVHDLDVYRLTTVQEVLDLGLEEMLEAAGVVFIEWGDAIDALLPQDHLQVELALRGEDDTRTLTMSAGDGATWAARWTDLETATASWAAVRRGA